MSSVGFLFLWHGQNGSLVSHAEIPTEFELWCSSKTRFSILKFDFNLATKSILASLDRHEIFLSWRIFLMWWRKAKAMQTVML